MLVKDDYSKFIYSIDVNNSVEYFCESAPNVSDRFSPVLVTTAFHSLRLLLGVMVDLCLTNE